MYVEQIKKFTQAGNVEFRVIETQQPSGNNVLVSEKFCSTSKTQKNCFSKAIRGYVRILHIGKLT
jgi:hypothetical protein